MRGRDTMVIVSSLPDLHKTIPLMLETLHHLRVLDFGVTPSTSCCKDGQALAIESEDALSPQVSMASSYTTCMVKVALAY